MVLGIKLVIQACYALYDQPKVVPLSDFLIAINKSENAMAKKSFQNKKTVDTLSLKL